MFQNRYRDWVVCLLVWILTLLVGQVWAGPLHDAAYAGDVVVIKGLLEKGESVNDLDTDGDAPLHVAVRMGKAKAVALLLANGAGPNDVNEWGESPLGAALQSFNNNIDVEIVSLLLENGADPNSLA